MYMLDIMERAVKGGLGVHSCIRVLLDGFLLKSVVFELIRKASVGHNMNIWIYTLTPTSAPNKSSIKARFFCFQKLFNSPGSYTASKIYFLQNLLSFTSRYRISRLICVGEIKLREIKTEQKWVYHGNFNIRHIAINPAKIRSLPYADVEPRSGVIYKSLTSILTTEEC
jgi:hypothetical protein